jgi:hypothetical protein
MAPVSNNVNIKVSRKCHREERIAIATGGFSTYEANYVTCS